MNMSAVRSHSHCVYGTQYELVLVTEGRKPLLTPRVATHLEELVRERVEAWDGEIVNLAIEPDVVHLSLNLPPTAAIADFVGALKTGTSRRLRNSFAGLKRRKRLWATSYFVKTSEGAAPGAVDAYLQQQS